MNAPAPSSNKPRLQVWKYLQYAAAAVRGIRVGYAVTAFFLAVTLWYTVTVRDKVESWVDVQVQFRDAPSNLVITEGLVNKLSVRVRAARGLSRGLVGRDAAVTVDLSSITRGSNAVAITRDMLPFTSAYEVVEISPSRILIVADTKASREVALESGFEGKLAPDFFVKSLHLNSETVLLSGAETLVAGVSHIKLIVPLAPDMPRGKTTVTVAVPVPANVSVEPPQVAIDVMVDVRAKQVKVTRPVTAEGYGDGPAPVVSPEKVTIVADIPESQVKDAEKTAAITASVAVPANLGTEPRLFSVIVKLPENADLVSVTPQNVTVTPPAKE